MNSDIIQSVFVASLSIVAVIIGATIQYVYTRFSEERKYQLNLRTQAYVDFLRCIGLLNKAQEYGDTKKWQEISSSLTETKIRISAYGNKEVISAILEFIHLGGKTDTNEGLTAFIHIVKAMREDCLGQDRYVTDEMICEMIFSPDIVKRFKDFIGNTNNKN